MHTRFTTTTSSDITFGSRVEVRFRIDGPGGHSMNATPPLSSGKSAPTAPKPPSSEDRPTKTAPTPPVSTTTKVRDAAKDGRISKDEKTTFEKPSAKDAIKSEEVRLREAVADSTADQVHMRDQEGELVLNNDGTPAPMGLYGTRTEHIELRDRLTAQKEEGSVNTLQDTIKQLKDAGQPTEAYESALEQRKADEAVITDAIDDKLALIGTFEGEKVNLEASRAENNTAERLSELETSDKFINAVVQFTENGGHGFQEDGGFMLRDSWDVEEKFSWDTMVDQFGGREGKVDEWADKQDRKSIDDGDSPLESARYDLRRAATEDLMEVMRDYETIVQEGREIDSANAGIDARIEQIDAEVDILRDSIALDTEALSPTTVRNRSEAARWAATAEHYQNNPGAAGGVTEPTTTTSSDRTSGKSGPTTPSSSDYSSSKSGPTTPSEADTSADDTTAAADGSEGAVTEETADVPDAVGATEIGEAVAIERIDYSKPENQAQVIEQAQSQGYLPDNNVAFNGEGQAVYTIQPGDSYWRIAESSSGPNGMDIQHFSDTMNDNVARLGRQNNPELIHPNEPMVLANRSIDELVQMLGLPTEVEVDLTDESDDEPPRHQEATATVPAHIQ